MDNHRQQADQAAMLLRWGLAHQQRVDQQIAGLARHHGQRCQPEGRHAVAEGAHRHSKAAASW
jgi:hypothetical protein